MNAEEQNAEEQNAEEQNAEEQNAEEQNAEEQNAEEQFEPLEPQWNAAHARIRTIVTQARSRSRQAVNMEMVAAYWEIGRVIAEEELRGAARADYGK